MTTEFKTTLENIVQFAAVLLQIIGLFVLKPGIFNYQGETELFAGGNIYNFILIFISIIFLFLGYTYSKGIFARNWFIMFIVFGILFIGSFFYYNHLIEKKTVIFSSDGVEASRFVKGDQFAVAIRSCAESIRKKNPDIPDLEIIKSCENITDVTQLYKIWPEKEIKKNMQVLNIGYCILISLASITLICGLQALKCKNMKNE
ncbi:hypothetical protein [Chryseobacterium rhizosphaerae]|uniref:DUF4199 domain-containing protein n=1 Tax=Chryseobacterium rhizosphaerae TaxID=395937 RepID=A0ABX9IN43_9FLAO|nr:hypothetical protein [Chryseobacterium rhizosphaerae]REC75889.1 hypothetical protein DRF57_08970 [Chryseobacterium rhizosphaerae]GEN67154.1 hypothetical protein CRH01_17220 [Chryseobacterium rhizosphaerae]